MHVIHSAKAIAEIEALRARGRERLADRAEEIVAQLEADPEGHRGVGTQLSVEGGGFGWARSVEAAGEVCVVAWVVEDGKVVVLAVKHRF